MNNRIDNIYIPQKNDPCQTWKNYFYTLKKRYGTSNAREAWLYTFKKSGNTSCTKDKTFNKWATQNKIAVADQLDKALAGVSGISQNLINGIESLTGLTPKVGAVVLIAGVGLGLFLVYKIIKEVQPNELIEALPSSKLSKMAKTIRL